MEQVGSEAAVHQPNIAGEVERSADELVCEIEYEAARKAYMTGRTTETRAAYQEASQRLVDARAARRADG